MRSHANSSSKSSAFSTSSSTQHASAHAACRNPTVAGVESSLQLSALALFGAASAYHPTHFSQPGLTQLQMAFMEVTESGLLSLEQLQEVGWLQPAAKLGSEVQPEGSPHPPTEAQDGGPPGVACGAAGALAPSIAADAVAGGQPPMAKVTTLGTTVPHDGSKGYIGATMQEQPPITSVVPRCGCAVAQAAAAAWQASQGADVELEYAFSLSSVDMSGSKSTIPTTSTPTINNNNNDDDANNNDNSNAGASWSTYPVTRASASNSADVCHLASPALQPGPSSDTSEADSAGRARDRESQDSAEDCDDSDVAGSADGPQSGGNDALRLAVSDGGTGAIGGSPSAESTSGAESRGDDGDVLLSADEQPWRLQVSRSQQEVVDVLRGMGFQGLQVEGPTQNQCMRVDIMLPSVDPALCAPFLAAGSSSGGNQTQEGHAAGSCPQAFGPVAIEFNGPDHYLAVPAYAPTGSTLLRRRQLQRHTKFVVSVPWWEWAARQSSGGEKEHYLAQLIMDGMKAESLAGTH